MTDQLKQDALQVTMRLLPNAAREIRGMAVQPPGVLMRRHYLLLDTLLAGAQLKVDCTPGCDSCCHYQVMVSVPELLALAEHIDKLPSAQRDALTARIVATARRTDGITPVERLRQRIPCALLQEGQCSVYALRPSACRRHHSGEVASCRQSLEQPDAGVTVPMDYQRKVAALAADNVQLSVLKDEGLDTARYELHAALAELLSGGAAKKRFKAGKTALPNLKSRVTLEQMTGD